MTISKKLTHKLFIAALAMAIIISSNELNAMLNEIKPINIPAAQDHMFDVYKNIKLMTEESAPDEIKAYIFNLFLNLVYPLIDDVSANCEDPNNLLTAIERLLQSGSAQNLSVQVLKLGLSKAKMSFFEVRMRAASFETVLHYACLTNALDCVKIILLAAEDEAWDLIITPNIYCNTAHDFAVCEEYVEIIKLLESYRP